MSARVWITRTGACNDVLKHLPHRHSPSGYDKESKT